MNLTIPDKLHKFLVLIGTLLIAFIYFQKENVEKDYSNKINSNTQLIDSIQIQIKKLEFDSQEMLKKSKSLSKKYHVENPLSYDKKSNLVFSRTLQGPKPDMIVSDSIDKYWNKHNKNDIAISLLIEKSKLIMERLSDEKLSKNRKIEDLESYEKLGLFLLCLGFAIWIIHELPSKNNYEFEHYSKKIEDRTYIHCQSCGNKFTSVRKYGNEINGENNYAFCHSCYQDGKFTNEDLTLNDVLIDTKKRIKHKEWIDKIIILNRIKKLERWEN